MDFLSTCWEFLRSVLYTLQHFPVSLNYENYLLNIRLNKGFQQKRWTTGWGGEYKKKKRNYFWIVEKPLLISWRACGARQGHGRSRAVRRGATSIAVLPSGGKLGKLHAPTRGPPPTAAAVPLRAGISPPAARIEIFLNFPVCPPDPV